MKAKAFTYFLEEVQAATATSPVWGFAEYWDDMTAKQRNTVAAVLDKKPEVNKMVRHDIRVYQFPTGREWQK